MKKSKDNTYIWGLHAAKAALYNPKRKIHKVLATAQVADELGLDQATIVDGKYLTKELPEGAVHQGIAVHASPLEDPFLESILPTLDDSAKLVVLDHVTDPQNVGAIIRTAAALGARGLVMTDKHSPPLFGTLAKAACGGLEVLPIFKVTNLARALDQIKEAGFWTVGLAEEGQRTIVEESFSGKLALVMGAEGEGLRRLTREKCDFLVKLPTTDDFSTLNVSVATAIALYELVRK